MKILSSDEIESLLGVKPTNVHPLEILGYGYTSEGAHKFRTERPDFMAQIFAHVQEELRKAGIYPADTNPKEPGYRTFIYADGPTFKLSSVEEVGFGRLERISRSCLFRTAAIRQYIRTVANPDYAQCEPDA